MLGPNLPYFWSTAARISGSVFFAFFMLITSRVMSRQMSQPTAWLLNVIRPSGWRSVT